LPVPATTAHAVDQGGRHHTRAGNRQPWRAKARLEALLDLNFA
jgi:hypothetical protein